MVIFGELKRNWIVIGVVSFLRGTWRAIGLWIGRL